MRVCTEFFPDPASNCASYRNMSYRIIPYHITSFYPCHGQSSKLEDNAKSNSFPIPTAYSHSNRSSRNVNRAPSLLLRIPRSKNLQLNPLITNTLPSQPRRNTHHELPRSTDEVLRVPIREIQILVSIKDIKI